jgi:CRISPR-associated exonuclease Cas4
MMFLLPILASVLFITAIILLFWMKRQKKLSGIPAGRIIYTDTTSWGKVEEPLYDPEMRLVGKPDYLVHNKDGILPVEVKSGHASRAPYDSHIFQLAAYCYLVEKTYGKRPAFGIVHYTNRTFAVDYTLELEQALLTLLDEIRQDARHKDVHRSHASAARCRGCGYRNVCGEVVR